MIVVDASAMVELVLRTKKGLRIAERLAGTEGPFLAPHLIDPEVMQTMRELVRLGEIDVAHADAALAAFVSFPMLRVPHSVLWTRTWALRSNLTAYDATYVVVAELAEAPLITCDGRLSRSPGHRATIELF